MTEVTTTLVSVFETAPFSSHSHVICVFFPSAVLFFCSFAAEPPLAGKACMFELLSAALVRPLNLEISVTANLASVCLHDAKHACMSLYLHLHLVC